MRPSCTCEALVNLCEGLLLRLEASIQPSNAEEKEVVGHSSCGKAWLPARTPDFLQQPHKVAAVRD